jgi:micrococcal nuclease
MNNVRRFLSMAFLLLCFACLPAQAATLFGKVLEVMDGDEIRIFNLNRTIRVKLIGIDAPESNQPFGDVAKQHLADLILNKGVVVEYSGLGHDGAIVGRVLLNDVDMNAQMIRDGVAWYDPAYTTQLNQAQREIYADSEQAARGEKRGLWQSADAIAPWQFVKNQQVITAPKVSGDARPAKSASASPAALTSEGLVNTAGASAAMAARTDMDWVTADPSRKNWERFQPAGESFSAMIPSGGRLSKEPIPFGSKSIDVNYYVARDGASVFALMWTTGPALGETDDSVMSGALEGFVRGIGAGYESLGGKFACTPAAPTDISTNGYVGRSFNLKSCTIPGSAKVFTKVSGEKRQLYLGAVFYMRPDDNVDRFITSFGVK